MNIRAPGANRWQDSLKSRLVNGISGHRSNLLSHEREVSTQTGRGVQAGAWSGLKSMCLVHTAQQMRASLLAKAQAALL